MIRYITLILYLFLKMFTLSFLICLRTGAVSVGWPVDINVQLLTPYTLFCHESAALFENV